MHNYEDIRHPESVALALAVSKQSMKGTHKEATQWALSTKVARCQFRRSCPVEGEVELVRLVFRPDETSEMPASSDRSAH